MPLNQKIFPDSNAASHAASNLWGELPSRETSGYRRVTEGLKHESRPFPADWDERHALVVPVERSVSSDEKSKACAEEGTGSKGTAQETFPKMNRPEKPYKEGIKITSLTKA